MHIESSSCFPPPLNTGSLFLLLKPCHLVTGLFWDAMGSFACLFDVFYYIFTSKSTAKLKNSTIFDRTLKIINSPLTQKRPVIRTKRPKPHRQKGVYSKRLGGWISKLAYFSQNPNLPSTKIGSAGGNCVATSVFWFILETQTPSKTSVC